MKYGLILADNSSGIFISGAPDNRWNNTDLNLLKQITASNFEVVQTGTIYNLQTSHRCVAHDQPRHRQSIDGYGWPADDPKLERIQQHLQHH